jgi:hypothetical protein
MYPTSARGSILYCFSHYQWNESFRSPCFQGPHYGKLALKDPAESDWKLAAAQMRTEVEDALGIKDVDPQNACPALCAAAQQMQPCQPILEYLDGFALLDVVAGASLCLGSAHDGVHTTD